MQTDKEFEDFFRERFNGLEETPPFNAWEKISQDIKPPRTYYREMAAAILLCLVSVCIFLGINQKPSQLVSEEIALENNTLKSNSKPASTSQIFTAQTKAPQVEKGKTGNAPENQVMPMPNATESLGANTSKEQVAATFKKAKSAKITLPLVAGIKKERPETKSERAGNKTPEVLAVTSRISLSAGLTPIKRYDPEAKNSGIAKPSLTSEEPVITAKQTNPATGAISENAVNLANSGSLQEANVAVAQNNLVKTDSVALPAIPVMPSDSVTAPEQVASNPELNATSKFAVTVNFTPGVIARRLIANPNDANYLFFADSKNTNRSADLGFDLNTTLNYQITPKTTLDAGFAYTKLHSTVQYTITSGQVNVQTKVVNSSANEAQIKVGYAYATEEFNNEFAYGGLRLGLTQELWQTKTASVFVSSGGGLNKLVSSRSLKATTSPTGEVMETSLVSNVLHTVNSHFYVNAGLAKEVLPNVRVLVAPAFTYYLNSALKKQQIFELKPYTFGLNFGLRYQF